MRLPLAELPGVLAKLCGASTMCWADLVAMYANPHLVRLRLGLDLVAMYGDALLTLTLLLTLALTLTLTLTLILILILTLTLTLIPTLTLARRGSRCIHTS